VKGLGLRAGDFTDEELRIVAGKTLGEPRSWRPGPPCVSLPPVQAPLKAASRPLLRYAGFDTQSRVAEALLQHFGSDLPRADLGKYSAGLLLAGWSPGQPILWDLETIPARGRDARSRGGEVLVVGGGGGGDDCHDDDDGDDGGVGVGRAA
jgi:hypothetical protein